MGVTLSLCLRRVLTFLFFCIRAVIDRPTLYTFHGVISSTQGFTIGSSPWDDSCKVLPRFHSIRMMMIGTNHIEEQAESGWADSWKAYDENVPPNV